MANKVGPLIKEARTNAGFTQEQLAKKISGITAADISKAERGEKELSQSVLKEIAKATGVTQASLVNAAKESTYSEKKSSSSSAKKTSSSAASSKKASSTSSSKKTASSGTSMTLTATEKKLVELYRAADSETKKSAMNVLKGVADENEAGDLLSTLLGSVIDSIGKK